MKTSTSTLIRPAKKKKSTKKTNETALSICPVNGAGWCPYPFSVEQLAKRLKKKASDKN